MKYMTEFPLWEVVQDKVDNAIYRVEIADPDFILESQGTFTCFYGKEAKDRANKYCEWLNSNYDLSGVDNEIYDRISS